MAGSKQISRKSQNRGTKSQPSLRTTIADTKGLAAINSVKKGLSPNISAAAKAEGTTVRRIRRRYPAALMQKRKGGPIRVKAGDPYSARVEILVDDGPVVVKARGSRERDLAGHHRAVYMQVLGNKLPASALEEFRGKKVGGFELISDYDRLLVLQRSGLLDRLDVLYASPGTGA